MAFCDIIVAWRTARLCYLVSKVERSYECLFVLKTLQKMKALKKAGLARLPAFLEITFLFLFGLNFSILPITFLFFVGGKIYSLVCITAIINAILFVHIFYSCVHFYPSYPHTPLLRIPLLLSVVEMK